MQPAILSLALELSTSWTLSICQVRRIFNFKLEYFFGYFLVTLP